MKYKQACSYAEEMRANPTPGAQAFWEKVKEKRFHKLKFDQQFPIEYARSSYFVAEFLCAGKKLIIEIEGDPDLSDWDYTKARDEILSDVGYHVVRFTPDQVQQRWEDVEQRILAAL